MRRIRSTSQFRRASKRLTRSGRFDRQALQTVIDVLARGEQLDEHYRDHALIGDLLGHRECHIKSNLLLIYRIEDDNLVLVLVDLGTHAELFGE